LLTSLRYLVLLPALGPLMYYALAIFAGWDYFRKVKKQPAPDHAFAPPVSILKAVRGVDREAYENFASMCRLDYPEYEIVFAVADENDPVIPLIERLQREFPERSIRLFTDIEQIGITRKTNSLCRLVREAKYELLVINDSDVRVEEDYLWDVVAPFADPTVGVVTAFFRAKSEGGLAADVNAVGVPTDSSASALVAWKLKGIDFALGWTMATTKERLEGIGGFERMVNHHSDDFELGNRIAKQGYRVVLTRKPVWMVFPKQSLGEFFKHEMRWSILLKNLRPVGYVGMFFTFGFAWSLLVAAIVPSWKVAAGYALAYLVLRMTVAWVVGVWGIGDPLVRRKPWLVPVRDALNIGVFVASFFSNTVEWRGLPYRVKGQTFAELGVAGNKRQAKAG
jgi:ceramide glucosyltransferase